MEKQETTGSARSRRSWLALGPARIVARVAAAAIIGYAALVFLVQRAVAFPGQYRPVDTEGPRAGVEQVWLETSFGRVEGWLFRSSAPDSPVAIFFHGNGELIDDWDSALQLLAQSGVTVLAVEFPGYGRSEGRPRRDTIRETAAAAYDWLKQEPTLDGAHVIGYGRSMGGGAAADLALDRPLDALILQSSFSSTMAMAATVHVPSFLVRDRFDPRNAVAKYTGPVLLMHGPDDEVIPYAHALENAAARPGLHVVDLPCGHNDCGAAWPEIVANMRNFLIQEGLLR
jgi:pimeloyl-ACP methyl ester carboxylesterase